MAQPVTDTMQPVPKGESSPGEGETLALDPKEIVVTRQVVETIAKHHDPDLVVKDYTVELGSKIGDNYMAIMYLVTVDVSKQSDPSYNKTHSMMLKTMPLNTARQMMVNETGVFVKETLMYGSVFPNWETMQKERGFKTEEIYKDYPLCYASFVDGKADYLALQNLRTLGYQMADRQKGLDRYHVNLVMRSLGKFHALSYVQFHGNWSAILETYPQLKERMLVPLEEMSEMSKMFMPVMLNNVRTVLESNGLKNELKELDRPELQPNFVMERMGQLISKPVPYAVIGHGDDWTNNMLFKYDPITNQPDAIKLIDFQISRPCSRTIDLLYFLIGCPQDELVNNGEKEFLRVYYDAFSSFAKKLGFFQDELTFDQLLQEYDEFRYFGVVMALVTMQFFFAKAEDVKDMETMPEVISEESAKDFLDGLSNQVIARKLANMLNVHLPRCKDFV